MRKLGLLAFFALLAFAVPAGTTDSWTVGVTTRASVDVLVCGAGPAGTAAALAARRAGLSVLLVEAQAMVGGMATSGHVSHWLGGRSPGGKWVVGGIFRELVEKAAAAGCAVIPQQPTGKIYQPHAWLPWFIHGIPLDPYRTASFLERMLLDEGVDLLLETRACDVKVEKEQIVSVLLHNKSGFTAVPCKAVIDATGDADIAAKSGASFSLGRDGDHMTTPSSLTFHVSHVDHSRLGAVIERDRSPKFRALIEQLRQKGEWPFPTDIFISVKLTDEDVAMINMSCLVGVDGTDVASRTAALVEGRRQAFALLDALKRHFPGFENAEMKSIAPLLGIRESRRIEGERMLTVADVRAGKVFPDTIGFSMYGWDLCDPKKPNYQPMVDESKGTYENGDKPLATAIPFGVMVPKDVGNLLCPGRSISVERQVLGPLRVMAPCMAMGQAAGTAAKWLASGKKVDVAALRDELRRAGCIVDVSALPPIEPRQDPPCSWRPAK